MSYRATLDDATRAAHAGGIRILQGHRLARTDVEHVRALLRHMQPVLARHAPGAPVRVLDIGSGFGEVARLMQAERPELDFIELNLNKLQLGYTPPGLPRVCADLHALPLADQTVDVCMFLYTLCHADYEHALYEAWRVTRPGGGLFVFDYIRLRGDNRLMSDTLFAHAPTVGKLGLHLADAGWWLQGCTGALDGDDATFREVWGDDQASYDAIFGELMPVIWHAVRR